MKLKVLSVLVIIYFFGSYIYAQSDLNAYKYVTIPEQYDFFKEPDKYKLNSLTKFLFDREGFKTLFSAEIKPDDLVINNCLNLFVSVKDNSNLLTTKLSIDLKNCRNEVVYTGEGRSKIKEYRKAHHEALRKALEPLNNIDYKFDPKLIITPEIKVSTVKETPILEEKVSVSAEVKQPVEVKEVVKVQEPINVVEKVDLIEATEVDDGVKLMDKVEAVEQTVKSPSKKDDLVEIDSLNFGILYAQKTIDGYQLVDSSPKVVFILLQSSVIDLFMLKDKNGIIFKKNNKWILEYYVDGTLTQKELNIKF